MVGRALRVVKIADLITTPFPVSPKKARAADLDARSRRGGGAPGQFRPAPRLCSSQEVRIGLGAVLPESGPLAPRELEPAAVRGKRSTGPKFGRGHVR